MDAKKIKKNVQEKYAAVAVQGGGCGPACCSPGEAVITPLVDYSALEQVPLSGTDLGLGCGAPTRFARLAAGEVVLDLGCGAGIDVFLAADEVGPEGHVIGVDITPEMIALAQKNAAQHGIQNVEFRLGEIEALPVEDASVDVVLSNCVINLVPDKRRAFAEIARVLRPGGRFIISDMVTFGEVPPGLRSNLELWAGCVAGALDEQEYLAIIREAGFSQVHLHARTEYPTGEGTPVPANVPFGLASITVEGIRV